MSKTETFKLKLKEILTNKTIIACAILTLIYLIGGYVKYLGVAVVVGAAVLFVVLPIQQAFCIFLFLQSYSYNSNRYGTFLGPILICFTCALLIKYCIGLKKGKYKFYTKIVIALSIFLVFWTAISFFHKIFAAGFMYISYFPLTYLMFAMRKEFNVQQGINYMLGGFISSCILALMVSVLPAYHYDVFYMDNRFNAFLAHTNHVHMRGIFLLSYYMYRYLKNNISTLKFILIYLLCAGFTLFCRSKTGILLLALFTLLFIILYLKDDFKHHIKFVAIFALIILVAMAAGYKVILEIVNRFVKGDGDFVSNFLTERNYIWLDYLKAIVKNPFVFLFGHGLVAEEVFIVAQNRPRASHNLYIFLLYRFGLIGCIALIYLFVIFIKALNKQRPKFISALPVIWVCVIGLIENVFNYFGITSIILAFMVLFADVPEKVIKTEEEKPNQIKEENVVENVKKEEQIS